jgi:predicted transcriptional regulator
MRPIVSKQNPLRYPLNELLGTRAHVRLLRVMANEVDGSLTASDAAKRAGLTVPGAQKALRKLFRSGFVSRVGGGQKHQYEIRCSDQLMQIVLELFETEKDRYEQLLTAIKKEIKNLTPHPRAAWIQAFPKEIGASLTLGLLHETRHLTNCIRKLRTQLNQVENVFDLTIEIEGYTKADISDLSFEGFTALYGVLPSLESPIRQQIKNPLTHREKDLRMHGLSRKLADAIEQDASLVRRAIEHIARLLKEDQGMATKDIREWRDILEMYSIQRLSRFLTSTSERANRLRQSNPFFAVLNPDERARLTNALEDKNDT